MRRSFNKKKVVVLGILGVTTVAVGLFSIFQINANASGGYSEDHLEAPDYPFWHKKPYHSLDHGAIRRGFQVYDQVGKACHSMSYNYYRELVDVAFTEDEVKAIAAEQEGYKSDPDENGEVHERKGEINDKFWMPFANDQEARAANNGALPPDLSLITKARHGGEDYVMAILTGYRDPPHGVVMAANMHYNIYFPGCQIGMPPPLAKGLVEYEKEDGSGETYQPSVSKMSHDVTVMLHFSGSKDNDERKLMAMKSILCLWIATPFVYLHHRRIAAANKIRSFYGRSTH